MDIVSVFKIGTEPRLRLKISIERSASFTASLNLIISGGTSGSGFEMRTRELSRAETVGAGCDCERKLLLLEAKAERGRLGMAPREGMGRLTFFSTGVFASEIWALLVSRTASHNLPKTSRIAGSHCRSPRSFSIVSQRDLTFARFSCRRTVPESGEIVGGSIDFEVAAA